MREAERIAHCPRCATMEDLLETARIQVEHARRESEKADDEAEHYKLESLKIRSRDDFDAYRAIKKWKRRAEKAEAELASIRCSTNGR